MLGRGKHSKSSRPILGLFYIPRYGSEQGIFAEGGKNYIFSEFLKVLSERIGKPFPRQMLDRPDATVNEYIKNYGMVVIMREGDQIQCFSTEYRNKLPQAFLDRVHRLEILPNDTVLWADDVFNNPQPAPAREVIYGQKPEKPPKRETRAQIARKWAHPQQLTPAELRFLMGQSDSPEG